MIKGGDIIANVKPIKIELQYQLKQLHIQNSNTKAQYMRSVNQFSRFLEGQGMKKATMEEAKGQIQNFIDSAQSSSDFYLTFVFIIMQSFYLVQKKP